MRLRCRVGMHGELSQGVVGHCRHAGCYYFKGVHHHTSGMWTRYTAPPTPSKRVRGLP